MSEPAYPEPGEVPPVGLYRNVPEWIYRSWNAVNQSALWPMHHHTPLHAREAYLNPRESSSFDLGRAVHAAALEPASFHDHYAIRPPGIDGRTREGKALLAAWRAENEGKTLLDKHDHFDTLEGVTAALEGDPFATDLLYAPGLTEVSIVWDDPVGVRCKARLDRIVEPQIGKFAGWSVILDVKSTKDASPRGMNIAMASFGYHMQAAAYTRGLNILSPRERPFLILAVESAPPFAVAIYEVPSEWMDFGHRLFTKYLETWAECEKLNHWPGYPEGVEVLDAPDWVLNAI